MKRKPRNATSPGSASRIRWFWCAAAILILVQAILWTVDGSGAARIRFFFQYPEGFNYYIDDPVLGRFLIQREDGRYITQYFLLLGNESLGISRDWPAQRYFYSLLVSGLWPVGFVIGGTVVNLVFWILAAVAAWKMTEIVGVNSQLGRAAAATLVVFHQGFLWSVGETNPHAGGYASGFLVLAMLAHVQAFKTQAHLRDLRPVAAVAGLLCLIYHSALLYLPMILLLALRAATLEIRAAGVGRAGVAGQLAREFAIQGGLIVGPMLLFRELLIFLNLLSPTTSSGGSLYLQMLPDLVREQPNWWLMMLDGFVAGFNAFGPLILIPLAFGSVLCLRDSNWRLRGIAIYFLGSMVFLIPNFALGDPGYASINLMPLVVLMSVVAFDRLFTWMRRSGRQVARIAAAIYVVGLASYANAPLLGVSFPLNVAWSGHYCLLGCFDPKYPGSLYSFREKLF